MATTQKTITTAYSLVGAGPLFFQQLNAGAVRYHIGASTPDDDTTGYHLMGGDVGDGVNYQGSENIYARTTGGTITVEATPIV